MDFEKFKIKEFDLWDLYLHVNQVPYLGRCYASAKRLDAEFVSDMNSVETDELFFEIIPGWKNVVETLYGSIRENVAFFGNSWNHLHAHLIPRFNDVRTFYGCEFKDSNSFGNYAPYERVKIEEIVLCEILDDFKSSMK